MPSDPAVSQRVSQAVLGRGFERRFFFGGDAWFVNGNFSVGVYHDRLTCRVGPEAAQAAIDARSARPMDLTGKPMKGWVFVDPPHFDSPVKLADWIGQAHTFASTLPAKTPRAKKKK